MLPKPYTLETRGGQSVTIDPWIACPSDQLRYTRLKGPVVPMWALCQ